MSDSLTSLPSTSNQVRNSSTLAGLLKRFTGSGVVAINLGSMKQIESYKHENILLCIGDRKSYIRKGSWRESHSLFHIHIHVHIQEDAAGPSFQSRSRFSILHTEKQEVFFFSCIHWIDWEHAIGMRLKRPRLTISWRDDALHWVSAVLHQHSEKLRSSFGSWEWLLAANGRGREGELFSLGKKGKRGLFVEMKVQYIYMYKA